MAQKIKIDKKYIPLDKSWIIRMGLLDLINEYDDIEIFLRSQKNLGDDLLALKRAVKVWKTNEPIDVGESGTLYRFLKFISWKLKLNKQFILKGTLAQRNICDDPEIVTWPQEKLLELDNNTTQWASAAVLLGDLERLPDPSFKLKLTYEAVAYWNTERKNDRVWCPRYDKTILKQAETYTELLNGGKPVFIPAQAEDYCFARAFGFITKEEGEKRWPSLRGHESDRILEMENVLESVKQGKEIDSKDHRVVQAIAMWGKANKKEVKILYPNSVNKSWPQFWDFINSK